jgi:hypothetical protein
MLAGGGGDLLGSYRPPMTSSGVIKCDADRCMRVLPILTLVLAP